MALVLPVLLMLLLGIVEFGRISSTGLMVNYSAREGSRLASTGAADSAVISRVRQSLPALDPTRLVIAITPEESARVRGQEISVRVSYPVTVTAPFIAVITGETVTVAGSCTMRIE